MVSIVRVKQVIYVSDSEETPKIQTKTPPVTKQLMSSVIKTKNLMEPPKMKDFSNSFELSLLEKKGKRRMILEELRRINSKNKCSNS